MIERLSPNFDSVAPPVSLQSTQEVILALCGERTPDVLYLLSGGVTPAGPNSNVEYRTPSFSSFTENGVATGSRARVIASKAIADAFPEMQIVTNSYNRYNPEEPTMSSVTRAELERRGISPSRITEENQSFSTATQLVEMINEIVKGLEVSPLESAPLPNVLVVTNHYHVPRTQAMFDSLEEIIDDDNFQRNLELLRSSGVGVFFVSAESVLRRLSPKFNSYLAKVEASAQYIETVRGEAKGLKDLQAGKYRIALEPEKPREKQLYRSR